MNSGVPPCLMLSALEHLRTKGQSSKLLHCPETPPRLQRQWPAWSGAKSEWVRLPPEPLPGLPSEEEEEVPARMGAPPEDDHHPLAQAEGAVDITGVGEGTERVRAGLEGPWGGISSASKPGINHEGGGNSWNGPWHSSVAIRPVANQWYDPDHAGFPGDITTTGNFPGVSPDNPGGTSEYIGMHR